MQAPQIIGFTSLSGLLRSQPHGRSYTATA
jgi:hypothetical protein